MTSFTSFHPITARGRQASPSQLHFTHRIFLQKVSDTIIGHENKPRHIVRDATFAISTESCVEIRAHMLVSLDFLDAIARDLWLRVLAAEIRHGNLCRRLCGAAASGVRKILQLRRRRCEDARA